MLVVRLTLFRPCRTYDEEVLGKNLTRARYQAREGGPCQPDGGDETMRHLKWIILAVVVVVLVVLGTLFLPGRLWIPPLTSEQLLMLEPDAGSPHSIPDDGMMLVDFGKTRGAPSIAGIFIYAEPAGPYTYNLRTTLQHDESYRIESMRLTFRIPVNTGGKLALVTPEGGPWNDPAFARDAADGSISFSVEHLGFLGTGSVGNEFVFQQFAQESGDEAAFSLHATFTLRSNGFLQLREHVVDTEIEIVLPGEPSAGEAHRASGDHTAGVLPSMGSQRSGCVRGASDREPPTGYESGRLDFCGP